MTDFQQPTYPPDPSVEPRRPRWSGRQKIAALAAILGLAVAGVLPFVFTGALFADDNGYGHDPVAQARRLHVCDDAVRVGDSTAACTVPLGHVAITTSGSGDEQDYLVAMIQARGDCIVVGKGWVVGAETRATVAAAVGMTPEAFASKYHGYVLCG
jgi:hypothetical protein